MVNISNPILKTERIISNNRLLITGLPANRQNLIQKSMTQQVAPAPANTYDEESVQSLLDSQKTRFKNDWNKFLPQINNNNHKPPSTTEGSSQFGGFTRMLDMTYKYMKFPNNTDESSTVMEGGSQSGGSTQTLYMQYEPED